jgi:hypothetical protein
VKGRHPPVQRSEGMDVELQLNVECCECGNGIEFPYRMFVNAAEYTSCSCGVEIQTYFDGTVLHINHLKGE